jgi:hypothetical protein
VKKGFYLALAVFLMGVLSFIKAQEIKLVHEIYYDWVSSNWENRPQIKNYVYDVNGDISAWEFGIYYPESDSINIDSHRTYTRTDFAGYYELRNYIYSTHSSNEDRYKYSLDGTILARYKKDIYSTGIGWTEYITDKIYNYIDGRLNYIFDHIVVDDWKKGSDEAYITYYYYDGDRLSAQNYHDYSNGNMLERTNWTYNDILKTAEATTEEIQGETWINTSKRVLYYDQISQLRKEERFSWADSLWTESEMDSIYYYDGSLIRRKIIFEYDAGISEYKPLDKIDYVYDDQTLGIEDQAVEVQNYTLYQNYPNPFNPVTTISYALPEAAQVELNVYNLQGQLVQSLVNGKMRKGIHKAEFNGADLTSGLYIYNLKVDGQMVRSKKMMLFK